VLYINTATTKLTHNYCDCNTATYEISVLQSEITSKKYHHKAANSIRAPLLFLVRSLRSVSVFQSSVFPHLLCLLQVIIKAFTKPQWKPHATWGDN